VLARIAASRFKALRVGTIAVFSAVALCIPWIVITSLLR
jgi:hypothetical protein